MKGKPEVIDALNKCLAGELVAIHQYMLHSRMLKSWGQGPLAATQYKNALEEMHHADELIERILFLEGRPDMQNLGRLRIGEDLQGIIQSDYALEQHGIPVLRDGIAICEGAGDYVSRDLLQKILHDEEEHLDWLETQLELMEKMGIQNYTQMHSGGE